MLSIAQKQQIFIARRKENYEASLRLEGFKTDSLKQSPPPTLEQLKAQYGR